MTRADPLDDALDLLAPYGTEWLSGLSNHGPMAAEALLRMGRPGAVVPWTEQYVGRLEPMPILAEPIDDQAWNDRLGSVDAFASYYARASAELRDNAWHEVARSWIPRLVPGIWGAAAHGGLRTAHAVRSLAVRESAQRSDELARALAYWASVYEELPGQPRLKGWRGLDDAMAEVTKLELPTKGGWLITETLAGITEVPEFPAVVESLGPTTVSEITRAFSGVYLANADHAAIALVHSVTAPNALRALLDFAPTESRDAAIGAAWRASAALLLAFGDKPRERGNGSTSLSRDELIDRAVASGDEHAIKLTAACLEEQAIEPDSVYPAAAVDVSARLRD
jgi:hypothetical protein